ncbi:MAG: MBL fold metallo-hydrolase [Bacteroidales bacterium]|jgi:glyoxylase-like metal-dependent hydrolase (beta-lactamase superfamily II)|nr:MBL fold metallo-hydrolase [Bacteroidales bacterium]
MNIHKLVFSPIEVNTYIIAGESGNCAILDCGCFDEKEWALLETFINDNKLTPVALLNTHCHLDHVFGNRFVLNTYNLKTQCHELEKPVLDSFTAHTMRWGWKMDAPPKPMKYIAHNEVIEFDNISLKALHVPGHTQGSLAFYSEADGCVFTGDALFAGSIGRTDLPGGNFDTLINSIQKNLFTLPPSTTVYPGHGSYTGIGAEITTNPWFRQ